MKQLRNIILSLLLLSIWSGCSDWLDLEPEDGVIREHFWKTKEETHSALMGCYASLMENDMMLRYFIWGEMRADMVTATSNANSDIIAIHDGEIVSSNQYAQWRYFYKTINQCNTVIDLAPLAKEKDLSFSEELLEQYTAEAVCIRSLAYFYLLRTFRDVPFLTQASIYDDQDYLLPATPQEVIVDSLINQLRRKDDKLPFSYNSLKASKGRFTAWGLKALLADIYLWKEDYAACAELCTQIINSGQFSLLPVDREEVEALDELGEPTLVYYANDGDISDLFNKMYYQGNSVESIFELQFEEDKNNPFVDWFRPVSGYLQANTININAEYFPSSSIDRRWSDIRPEFSFKQSGGTIWKWIGINLQGTEYRDINASFCNWIFYRLADIILMKAEALTQQAIIEGNNQEKLQETESLLKQIRTRANAPESTDLLYKQDAINARTFEELILNERAREFLFEGKRWFDVLRYVKRDNFRNKEYLLRLAVLSVSPEKISIVQEKWLNYPGSLYMPIYFEELDVNKNLIQNEFYR
jgi:hypothetical protein